MKKIWRIVVLTCEDGMIFNPEYEFFRQSLAEAEALRDKMLAKQKFYNELRNHFFTYSCQGGYDIESKPNIVIEEIKIGGNYVRNGQELEEIDE